MIGIVDYNAGNIRSVERALEKLGTPYILSKKPCELAGCSRLIFPGVGDAAYAMEQLHASGFDVFLKEWAEAGKPVLGICLGSQIIFDYSEEGNVECLGLLKGRIRHFENIWKEKGLSSELKIPHMGWNDISYINGGSAVLKDVKEHSDFYFVHSYVICPDDSFIIKAQADYGIQVPAVVQNRNIIACQFHPEKSGLPGMKILQNYCSMESFT